MLQYAEQYADSPGLVTSLPTVEQVLDDHASQLGHDLIAYRNHVYRVVNLCLAIAGDSRVEVEKIALTIAATATNATPSVGSKSFRM